MASQPELPNLEMLVEAEAVKTKDEYHHARWIVPSILCVVGLSVFLPLALTISPYFYLGTLGMCLVGAVLGLIFNHIAKKIPPTTLLLRKRSMTVLSRLNGLRNLLGWSPVLSPRVGQVLEEAATIYLKVCPAQRIDEGTEVWNQALAKARSSMDEAMVQMLALAEPDTPQAQDAELDRGWAEPLLEEMRATEAAVDNHLQRLRLASLMESQNPALAGLREARSDLERLGTAVTEFEQEIHLREGT